MPLTLEATPIAGLKIVRRTTSADPRGSFARLFDANDISWANGRSLVQVNHSVTRGAGTVRGMHYQNPPYTETKIVTCLQGEVFDVALDLRRDSPTFLKWFGLQLSAESSSSLLVPPGLAHGFQLLSDEAHLLYLHDQPYQPHSEGRVHPLDLAVVIDWPQAVQNLSERDRTAPFLAPDFPGLAIDG